MKRGEEVRCEAVISSGDAPEVFEAVEHPLDGVAPAVKHWREAAFPAACDFGRDVRRRAALFDRGPDGVGVIAFVAVKQDAGRQLSDQRLRGRAIGDLRAGEQESDRSPGGVAQGVDLGAASSAGPPDGLAPFPPFPAAAERCARTAELSISTSAGGPPTCARD